MCGPRAKSDPTSGKDVSTKSTSVSCKNVIFRSCFYKRVARIASNIFKTALKSIKLATPAFEHSNFREASKLCDFRAQ